MNQHRSGVLRRMVVIVAGMVCALALIGGSVTTGAPVAAASPPSGDGGGGSGNPSTQDLSKKTKSVIAAVASMHRSVDKKKRTLDYRKASKYDKGQTTTRRKFAAGYLWTGGKIKNISKTELKKVKKYLPKKKYAKVRAGAMRRGGDAPVKCAGVTKITTRQRGPWFDNRYYYNSCDTAVIILVMDQTAIAGGVLLGLANPAMGASLAAVVTAGSNLLKWARDQSDLKAVIVRDTFHVIRVYPQ